MLSIFSSPPSITGCHLHQTVAHSSQHLLAAGRTAQHHQHRARQPSRYVGAVCCASSTKQQPSAQESIAAQQAAAAAADQPPRRRSRRSTASRRVSQQQQQQLNAGGDDQHQDDELDAGRHRQEKQPDKQQQQEKHPGAIPPQEVWEQELRHLQGLMVDPHKPLLRQFVLQQCYVLNSPRTQQQFRAMSSATLGKIAADRQRLEVRLSRAVNALSAAWRRLQLLQEAVVDQGSALSEPQLAKERELIVDTRDRLKQLQRLYNRTVSKAQELGDTTYLSRSPALNQLLVEASAAAESYLATGMANIAAASRVNTMFRNAWSKTPPAQRPAPAVAEVQRQSQLAPLLPLLPDDPQQLLSQYKQVAMTFRLYADPSLQRRAPSHGLPSSTATVFWQQDTMPAQQQQQGPQDGVAGGVPAQSVAEEGQQQQQQHQQQRSAVSQVPPPLQTGEAAWQQLPRQMLGRPPQQLPLLPHLARPWVKQQTLRFRQQQEQRQEERGWQQGAAGGMMQPQQPDQQLLSPRLPSGAPVARVVPPLPVLLKRALEVEQQLVQQQQKQQQQTQTQRRRQQGG